MCCFPEAFILEQSGLNIKQYWSRLWTEADVELQKPENTRQKTTETTANDGGRTSPTSCRRHASNKPVFIFNKFNIQRKAILFIKISVFNRNLCISEDQPLHPMYKCSFSLDFALIKHFANMWSLRRYTISQYVPDQIWLQFEPIIRVELYTQHDF